MVAPLIVKERKMEKLDTQQVILGAVIALLRQRPPPMGIENQILEGMRLAKKLLVDADLAKDAGQSLIIEDIEGQVAINAQNVGVYLQPQWAAKEGVDKSFNGFIASVDAGDVETLVTYTVPNGSTLYITQLGFGGYATTASGAKDDPQVCRGIIFNNSTSTTLFEMGGDGGGGISFSTPIVVDGGDKVLFRITNGSDHAMVMYISAGGYEI